jgi:hypothetical protein
MPTVSSSGTQRSTSSSGNPPIATEVHPSAVGTLLIDDNKVTVSQEPNKSYLTFGNILEHLFSFFTSAHTFFFSYASSKDTDQNQGELISKPSESPSEIVTETTAEVVSSTSTHTLAVNAFVINDGHETTATRKGAIEDIYTACNSLLMRKEAIKNWEKLSDKEQIEAKRNGYERYIHLSGVILKHSAFLSPETKVAAEGIMTAATEL